MEGKRLTETVIYEVEQWFYDGCGKNQCETTKNVFPIVKKTNRLPRLINLNDIQKKNIARKSFNCKQFRNKTDWIYGIWYPKTFSNYKSIVNILDFIHGFVLFVTEKK